MLRHTGCPVRIIRFVDSALRDCYNKYKKLRKGAFAERENMTKNTFRVHTAKYAAAFVTVLAALVAAALSLAFAHYITACLFLLVAAAFSVIGVMYGSVVSIDETGVRRSFWGVQISDTPWYEIAEVGIVGVKVFNNNNPKRTGSRYIYFSKKALTDDERFKLALEWPPKDMPYLLYTRTRIDTAMLYHNKEIATYNAGDIFANPYE